MGIKSKLEQSIHRAQREGRTEDAYDLEQELITLKKQRGDAAWARKHTYVVQPGDSYFSIAGSELGDERWAAALHDANPGLDHLTPGMEIILPQTGGTPSLGSQQETDALIALLEAPPPVASQTAEPPEEPASGANDTATEQGLPPGVEEPLTSEEEALVEEVAQELEQMASLGLLQLPGYSPLSLANVVPVSLDPASEATPGPTPTATPGATPPSAAATGTPTPASIGTFQPTQPDDPVGQGEDPEDPTPNDPLTWEDRQRMEAQEAISSRSSEAIQYDLTEWTVADMLDTAMQRVIRKIPDFSGVNTGNQFGFSQVTGALLGQAAMDISKAYKLFSSGSLKDVKIKIQEELGDGIVLCGVDQCQWVDYSVPGNIIFGYNMQAGRIDKTVYTLGAGYAQTMDDFPEVPHGFLNDDPEDATAVAFGAYLFDKYGTDLTVDVFKRELTREILESFQDPPEGFAPPQSAKGQENLYPPGYFDNED
jgi:hypothetical protein